MVGPGAGQVTKAVVFVGRAELSPAKRARSALIPPGFGAALFMGLTAFAARQLWHGVLLD